MLPTSPTNVLKTIPSYLYFQYLDDQNLPSLISAYNTLTQEYVDWFNDINLPIYTGLSGALLDWIGQGIYGVPRPSLSTTSVNGVIGQIGGLKYHGAEASGPTPNIALAIATTQAFETTTVYTTPDDIYKRVLTWLFYKGDGSNFSIPWLKRRIARFLYGVNGTDVSDPWTPNISVTFNEGTSPLPTCEIVVNNAVNPVATYFQLAVEDGVLSLPMRFQYSVTINT